MYTIYQYSHDATTSIELAFLVAKQQPMAGGCTTAEDSARIIQPVAEAPSIEAAREWITDQIPAEVRPHCREMRHSQAELCIQVEWSVDD